ncbi:MAG: hypothetical protein E6K10_05575, partial [Methanobacteriota archaeon]
AVLVGETESKKGTLAVKDLDSGKQEEMRVDDLVARAKSQRPRD